MADKKDNWFESFKNRKDDDGPRDTSHGAVQRTMTDIESPKIAMPQHVPRGKTLNKMSSWFQRVNLLSLKKKKLVEESFRPQLPDSIVQESLKSRRSVKDMQDRYESAAYIQQRLKNAKKFKKLKELKPKEWNNVPIPVRDAFSEILDNLVHTTTFGTYMEDRMNEVSGFRITFVTS